MDFNKFISLIDSKCLFFPTQKILADVDPFEGATAVKGSIGPDSQMKELYDAILLKSPEMATLTFDEFKKSNNLSGFRRNIRYTTYISCWHMNDCESMALWKIYAANDGGICIQTTYEKLKKSIVCEDDVYIGSVKYIDYNTSFVPLGNTLLPTVHKRSAFEHEKELRAVICDIKKFSDHKNDQSFFDEAPTGRAIQVNLRKLIERIILSPTSPDWMFNLTKNLCEKYKLKILVEKSSINDRPSFR